MLTIPHRSRDVFSEADEPSFDIQVSLWEAMDRIKRLSPSWSYEKKYGYGHLSFKTTCATGSSRSFCSNVCYPMSKSISFAGRIRGSRLFWNQVGPVPPTAIGSKNGRIAFEPSNAATRAIVDSERSLPVNAEKLHLEFLLAQGPDFQNVVSIPSPILPRTINLSRRNYPFSVGTRSRRLGNKSGCRNEAE